MYVMSDASMFSPKLFFKIQRQSIVSYNLNSLSNANNVGLGTHSPAQLTQTHGMFSSSKTKQPSHVHFILITWTIPTLYFAFCCWRPFFWSAVWKWMMGSAQKLGRFEACVHCARTTNKSEQVSNVLHHHNNDRKNASLTGLCWKFPTCNIQSNIFFSQLLTKRAPH